MAELVPFVGPSYKLNTPESDVQRVVNMYPVRNEVAGGKTGVYLESIPGLTVFSSEAPPPTDWSFLDTFGGYPDGTLLSARPPDTHPEGCVWINAPVTDQSLQIVDQRAVTGPAGGTNNPTSPATNPMPLFGPGWEMRMALTATGGGSEGGPSCYFVARTENDINGVRIIVQTLADNFFSVQVTWEGGAFSSDPIPGDTAHHLEVNVGPASVYLLVDGGFVAGGNYDMSAYSHFVGAFLAIEGDGELSITVDSVAVEPNRPIFVPA